MLALVFFVFLSLSLSAFLSFLLSAFLSSVLVHFSSLALGRPGIIWGLISSIRGSVDEWSRVRWTVIIGKWSSSKVLLSVPLIKPTAKNDPHD